MHVTQRVPGALTLLLAVLWSSATPSARDSPGVVTHPYVGITLIERTLSTPRQAHLHIAQVDLRAPGIRVAVSPPAGGRETVREGTLSALTRLNAQLAVNGQFFLPFPSDDSEAWVIGLAASEGRVYSAFESPGQSFAILRDAPALNIDRANHGRIVHRRRGGGDRRVVERVTLWNAVAGSAQIVTDGRVSVPIYRDAAHPQGALTPGLNGRYANDHSWYEVVTSRTVAGLSRQGRILTLAAVEGKGGIEGLTPAEIAALLIRDYGVWNAINLDGGGSTTMAWRDPDNDEPALLNTPQDATAGGRAVANSLLVFARRPAVK
ncbi:MAG: phosphodiester glycosidase family protein [Acidobacteriota bacterium]